MTRLLTLFAALFTAALTALAQPFPHFRPTNPNATAEAQALLERLYTTVDEGRILSGLHHNQLQMPNYRRDLDRINEAAPGAVPMVWGGDVAWDADRVVQLAIDHHRRGYVIALTWHAARPYDTGRVNFREQTQGKFSAKDWKELVHEGSRMNALWLAQVDSIAEYLKVLQDNGVPVLWRPFHEMNGEWFWWGDRRGKDGIARLWQMLYHRLTDFHHLNNLIWVWNPNNPRRHPHDSAMAYELYYPGHEYVDVLAADVYHREWFQDTHDQLVELGEGRLLALGEVGELPTAEQLSHYNRYAWFMLWTSFSEDKYNTISVLHDVFASPRVVNKQEDPCRAASEEAALLQPQGRRISPADSHIDYIGRVSFAHPERPTFTFPGVQIRTAFTGTSLRMIAKPRSGYFMAQIDGAAPFKVGFNAERDSLVNLATALPWGRHEVQLMYVTEGYDRRAEFRGFVVDEGCSLQNPTPMGERRIEFIGNSITCGYGVESTEASAPFQDETCNHYYTYAARTARNLGAQHVVVARSGIGVYRNYNGPTTGDSINMNTEYTHTLLYDATEQWDFSRFTPDVVCINLGTNDTSTTGADPALLKAGYVRLLSQVRKAYPAAKIVFLCGCMMHEAALDLASQTMDTVVAEAHAAGDREVYRFDFAPQEGDLGYGASWHPSYWQHANMADELTPFLRQLMGWK